MQPGPADKACCLISNLKGRAMKFAKISEAVLKAVRNLGRLPMSLIVAIKDDAPPRFGFKEGSGPRLSRAHAPRFGQFRLTESAVAEGSAESRHLESLRCHEYVGDAQEFEVALVIPKSQEVLVSCPKKSRRITHIRAARRFHRVEDSHCGLDRDASSRWRNASLRLHSALKEGSILDTLRGFESKMWLKLTDRYIRGEGNDWKHGGGCCPGCRNPILQRWRLTACFYPQLSRNSDFEFSFVVSRSKDEVKRAVISRKVEKNQWGIVLPHLRARNASKDGSELQISAPYPKRSRATTSPQLG